jgi:uncharacterized protein (TIGR02466 family)
MPITQHFATSIYRANLVAEHGPSLIDELEALCRILALDDTAGRRWCRQHGYPGYTSYASLDDLPWRFPPFKMLEKHLARHAKSFAQESGLDLRGRKQVLAGLWVNLLEPGGLHGSHIHPNAVVSGTYYVATPPGAGAIRFEDPRLGLKMHAPPRRKQAEAPFLSIAPDPGSLLLWESWLRHEVPLNQATTERISISFNYDWA